MQIKNPTKDSLEVMIKGIGYSIEPEGTLNNVPEEHARYWQENLHKFIQIKKDGLETPPVQEVVTQEAPIASAKRQDVRRELIEEAGMPEQPTETGLAQTEEDEDAGDEEEVEETETDKKPVEPVAEKTNKKK